MLPLLFTLIIEVVYVSCAFNIWLFRVLFSRLMGAFLKSVPHPLQRHTGGALSPGSLTKAIGRQVKTVTTHASYTGLVADGAQGTIRTNLRLELEDGEHLDVFIKRPPKQPWLEAFLWFCGLYQTELWFYEEQAKGKLKVPTDLMAKPYYVQSSGTTFMVCLADISKPSNVSPTGADLLNLQTTLPVDRLKLVLHALARLHALHIGQPLTVWSEMQRSPFLNLLSLSSFYFFRRKYPMILPPEVETCYSRFLHNYKTVRKYWSASAPQTLVHGDVHSGNVFFKGDNTVGFFDWQVVSAEHPMRDVTYFLFYAASEATLAAHEQTLIKYYLSCLHDNLACTSEDGLVPTFDDAWFNYRIHAFYPLLAAVTTAGLGDFITDGDAVRAFARRVVAHFQRVDASTALEVVLGQHDKRSDIKKGK